ncbi:hypothetical protein P5V15_015776 [Pogonomyrmex californicus]
MIVFGKTFEEIKENLREILLRFRAAKLSVNPKKCNLFRRQVKYLEKSLLILKMEVIYNKDVKAYCLKNDNDIFRFRPDATIEEYRKIDLPQQELVYKELRLCIKGDTLHPSSVKKLNNKFPEEKWEPVYEEIKIEYPNEKIETFILPSNANLLAKMYNIIVLKSKNSKLVSEPNTIAPWISLYSIYGELFLNCYDEYITDPDPNIRLTSSKEELEKLIMVEDTQYNYTIQDIKATCDLKVKDNFLTGISIVFRALPKFCQTLFFFMRFNQSIPELATAQTLLHLSSMTTISCIINFINMEKRTLAHSEKIMLSEIKNFLNTIKNKQDEHGKLWPYHRVLYPEDGDLNANKFPNLAVASVTHFKEYGPTTFKNMVTPKMTTTIADIERKSITYDNRDIYVAKEEILTEAEKEGAKAIGLDLSKLRGTRQAREEIKADKQMLLAIQQLMSQFPKK